MAISYEDVNPTLIPNTTMRKLLSNGVHITYNITPNPGYVLHDKDYDYPDEDGNLILGYRTTMASCRYDYDFVANPNEFYTVPESEVPADQIFGGENDHEVM